jgi:hypothetical protein
MPIVSFPGAELRPTTLEPAISEVQPLAPGAQT